MSDARETNAAAWPFRGICLNVPRQQDLDIFQRLIAEVLPRYGCNALVLLVRYHYQFQSHPQVGAPDGFSPAQAAEIAACCRANGIRLIPKMNLMGHQYGCRPCTPIW